MLAHSIGFLNERNRKPAGSVGVPRIYPHDRCGTYDLDLHRYGFRWRRLMLVKRFSAVASCAHH